MKKQIKQVLTLTAIIAMPLIYLAALISHPIATIIGTAAYMTALKIAKDELNRQGNVAARLGKAQVFSNVTWFNGDPVDEEEYSVLFGILRIPVILNSDQGPIVVVHGIPSYTKGFWGGFCPIDHRWLSRLLPGGQIYWLISCHNSFHGNFVNATRAVGFRRPIPSISPLPCFCDYSGKEKTLTVYANNRINVLTYVALPIMLYAIPLLQYFYVRFTPYKAVYEKVKSEQIQIGLLQGEVKVHQETELPTPNSH